MVSSSMHAISSAQGTALLLAIQLRGGFSQVFPVIKPKHSQFLQFCERFISITTFNMQYPPTISRTCQKFALLSLSDDPVTCDIKTDQESLSLPNWEEEDELLLWKCIALHKPESAALLTVSIEDECRSPSARKTKVSKNQFTSILSNSKTECADLTQLTFRSSLTSRRFPIMGKGGLRRLQNSKLFTKSKATMRKATAAETENKPASMEKFVTILGPLTAPYQQPY
ncbi:Glycogen phosphorylase [Trichinella pseudospiralis]